MGHCAEVGEKKHNFPTSLADSFQKNHEGAFQKKRKKDDFVRCIETLSVTGFPIYIHRENRKTKFLKHRVKHHFFVEKIKSRYYQIQSKNGRN